MKIVVLAGGLSTERDVSLLTGSMVSAALKRKGHQVLLLDVFMGYGTQGDDLTNVFKEMPDMIGEIPAVPTVAPDLDRIKSMRADKSNCFFGPNVINLCQMADIVFLALHGENGEDGRIQATFDLFGIRYTGSNYLSSAIAMNKQMSKRFFTDNNIPTPRGISMKKSECIMDFDKTGLTLPCVVKPCCGGSSVGVSVVRTPAEYQTALNEAFRWENEVVIEDYIHGREFSIAVIESKALPIIEIAPKEGFYDYKNKYKAGSTIETCPADLPQDITSKMQQYAVAAAQALGLTTYARIDFMLNDQNQIFCLEANTLPGMTPTSLMPQEAQAIGVQFDDLCEWLINISLNKK
ncbi:MAG: D-alanine--D-alanine ligase [Alphaproteobacteria bacterium]|nr:D-alanine--D-alanine ligase [Alphaproteobacteria bacterium]